MLVHRVSKSFCNEGPKRRKILECSTLAEALKYCFAVYFILNLQYPKRKMHPDSGTKAKTTSKKKSIPTHKPDDSRSAVAKVLKTNLKKLSLFQTGATSISTNFAQRFHHPVQYPWNKDFKDLTTPGHREKIRIHSFKATSKCLNKNEDYIETPESEEKTSGNTDPAHSNLNEKQFIVNKYFESINHEGGQISKHVLPSSEFLEESSKLELDKTILQDNKNINDSFPVQSLEISPDENAVAKRNSNETQTTGMSSDASFTRTNVENRIIIEAASKKVVKGLEPKNMFAIIAASRLFTWEGILNSYMVMRQTYKDVWHILQNQRNENRHFKKSYAWCNTDKNTITEESHSRDIIAESNAIISDVHGFGFTKEFCDAITSKFRNDEIGDICRNDILILKFGAMQFEKYGTSQSEMIRQNMRQLARLTVSLRKLSNNNSFSLNNFSRSRQI
ncbi:hypothetical protein NQ317_000500 [Molorchus minor]|uniref:Uncharacterized protein n=1 Tax=Molorchus minor TaxID=1323400 RepID=A0ABQ9IQZ9_9CUCU|nr:hypothetical protein NQ317_000500 [Molorchus minor]